MTEKQKQRMKEYNERRAKLDAQRKELFDNQRKALEKLEVGDLVGYQIRGRMIWIKSFNVKRIANEYKLEEFKFHVNSKRKKIIYIVKNEVLESNQIVISDKNDEY